LGRDPELVREFEQSLRLREGLEQLREQGYFEQSRRRTTRRLLMYVPALAAAALAAVAVILWVQPRTESPGVLRARVSGASTGAAAVSAHFTSVATLGSSASDPDLPSGGLVEFRAAPPSHAAGARYGLTLARVQPGGGEEPLGTLTGVVPGTDG